MQSCLVDNPPQLEDNRHAVLGTELYERFASAFESLEGQNNALRLAFHGTPTQNIPSICENNLDPELRGTAAGQKLGPGKHRRLVLASLPFARLPLAAS